MIIIPQNEQEQNALKGVLNWVKESAVCYWDSDSDIDYDKKECQILFDIKEHLQRFGVNQDFDLSSFLNKLNGDNWYGTIYSTKYDKFKR